jgi:hypothetical protein
VVPEATQVLVLQVDLAEVSQVQVVLEVRLVDSQVQGQQAVEYHQTQNSHLVEAVDRLSQTENTYRLTVGNNSMTANEQELSRCI